MSENKSTETLSEEKLINTATRVRKRRKKLKWDFKIDKPTEKESVKMLFIGQPNVGKSSLLNALVGTKIAVSNYPGTSVELTQAEKDLKLLIRGTRKVQQVEYFFIDTPGIYSISERSPEETITKRTILSKDNDVIILIADCTALERSLYFALQVLESGQNLIIGLNFVEEAYKKGITIDANKLSKILGVEAIPFNPITRNLENLIITATKKANNPSKECFTVIYDDHIEEIISCVIEMIEKKEQSRFIALRILEGDTDYISLLKPEQKVLLDKKKSEIADIHPEIKEEISKTRYGTSAYIAEQVTLLKKFDKSKEKEKPLMDKLLLHRIWGPFFTTIFFLGLFSLLLYLGGLIQQGFVLLGNLLIGSIPSGKWAVGSFSFLDVISEGLAGVFAGVAIALPYVLLFYLILGVTEDIGLLPRFVINIARLFEFLGLPSKGFISMILNVGCTIPAITSTRIIKRKSDRMKTAFMFAFIPCSSRLGIILGIVGFFGSFLLAIAVFCTLLFALIIWTLLLKVVVKEKTEPLLIELPAYRKPIIKNVFSKSWLRMKEFVKVVIPLLIAGGIIFSILDQLNVTNFLIAPFNPVLNVLFDLPGETIVPIVFGFIQKDLTGAMLIALLGTASGGVALTNLQLYTFGLVTSIGIPCIIALFMMIKEFKIKNIIAIFIAPLVYGILISSLAWRIISLFM